MRVVELLTPRLLGKNTVLFLLWLFFWLTSSPSIYFLYNKTPCSHFLACFIAVLIKLPPTCLTCVCYFVRSLWSKYRFYLLSQSLCEQLNLHTAICTSVKLVWVILFSSKVRSMVLLRANLVCDSLYIWKWKEQCVLRWECREQPQNQVACVQRKGLKREIGVSIKCGRHRRGCFLLVKVYRKSGDGAALRPVAPHHKSHFPLFKLRKFSLVNLPHSAIGNIELHAFISQPALLKSCFFF